MAFKLFVYEERYLWRIAWADEDGEPGLHVGDYPDQNWLKEAPVSGERDDWEIWVANRTAFQSFKDGHSNHDALGFFWESMREANAVLRQIKEALKQERPLPEWAKTALAAGWKPPKGWKA
jgi:hypothetical protein